MPVGSKMIMLCVAIATAAMGQTTGAKPQMAEDVYKDIRLLKGMPVDQFLDTMGFFSASTNLNCIDCHGTAAGGDWSRYADDTPKKTADIILLQGNPLENIYPMLNTKVVLRSGKVVVDKR